MAIRFFSKGWRLASGALLKAPTADGTAGQALLTGGDGTSYFGAAGTPTLDAGTVGGRGDSGPGALQQLSLDGLSVVGTTLTVTASAGFPPGHFDPSGFKMSNNGTDADHDIDIAAGSARGDANTADIVVASAMTKQLDAAWVVGTNQGMRDTGTIAANEVYHVFAIRRSDTGVTDYLASLSATAPTMPTGYDSKVRIGAILTDSSANIRPFDQERDLFQLKTPVSTRYNNPGTTAVLRTLTVPDGVRVRPVVGLNLYNAGDGGNSVYVSSPAQTDFAGNGMFQLSYQNSSFIRAGHTYAGMLVTNTSGQIRTKVTASGANTDLDVTTFGWFYPRGRD